MVQCVGRRRHSNEKGPRASSRAFGLTLYAKVVGL